jgi:cobalt-zinc-cadmium efflux system outer membrane protein
LEARQRYAAALARVAGQGVRPDPLVEAGVMNLWGFMGPQVSVSQTFPLGGKLGAERTMAEAEAAVAYQAYRQVVNDLYAEVGRTYFDLYVWQQAAAIVEKNKQLLGQMAKVANARYAVGQGKQSDVVRTNTQIAEMLHEALMVRQQRESTSAKLMGLLNKTTSMNEGTIATPATPPFVGQAEDLLALADGQNPAILMAQAEVVAGEADLAAARTVATPDVTAKIGLGQAFMDMGWQPVVSGMVGTNLPMGSRERQRAAVAGAEADLAARRAALANRRREVEVALNQDLTHVRHLTEQLRLYRQGLLPQARLAIQSELANYQVGRSAFDAVLAAQLNQYRSEREYQQAIADYRKMLVEIEALTGEHAPAAKGAP